MKVRDSVTLAAAISELEHATDTIAATHRILHAKIASMGVSHPAYDALLPAELGESQLAYDSLLSVAQSLARAATYLRQIGHEYSYRVVDGGVNGSAQVAVGVKQAISITRRLVYLLQDTASIDCSEIIEYLSSSAAWFTIVENTNHSGPGISEKPVGEL